MPLRKPGDAISRIERWATLARHADRILGVVSKALAEETIALIKDGFRTETDPYGDTWQPKKRPDGRKTLSGKTSLLKGGWHFTRADPAGFEVRPSVTYASPHQDPQKRADGRLKRPRRMMVPTDERGLPTTWRRAYDETISEVIRSFLDPKATTRDVRALRRNLGLSRIGSGGTS